MDTKELWAEITTMEQGMKIIHDALDRLIADAATPEIHRTAEHMKRHVREAFESKLPIVEAILALEEEQGNGN